jgi:orotidine-5'-phosphate decarboxylase
MQRLIQRSKSMIPACDVSFADFETLLSATADLDHIGAYKIGAVLGLSAGLPSVVSAARRYTSKPLIYDHQKAATDIPDTAEAFMRVLRDAGIDAVILFPLSGPKTQLAWMSAGHAAGLTVIVGAHMTHPGFVASDGGYINDEAIDRMLRSAADAGVHDYVVPGTHPGIIRRVRALLESTGIEPVLYTPGLVAQGGVMAECRDAVGSQWHAIVGRALYGAKDLRAAAIAMREYVE